MGPESSTADRPTDSDPEEDYDCPICQEVFKKPVRTKGCKHVFCKSCFETAVESQGHCPLCRGPVAERAQRAKDVQERMRKRSGHCRACGAEKVLSKMRHHYKSCRKYIQEFGTFSDAAPSASTQMPAQIQNPSRGFISILPIYTPAHSSQIWMQLHQPHPAPQAQSAGRVYSCPYCPLVGMRDMELVQHCAIQHAGENRRAVCPICMQMPWGNEFYYSQNLIGHMRLRHSFSYAGYMNEEEGEDSQICRAVQISLQDF